MPSLTSTLINFTVCFVQREILYIRTGWRGGSLKRVSNPLMRFMKKINERMQGNLKEEVVKDRMKIEKKYTGTKRGKYKARKRYDDRTKVVSSVMGTEVYKGETFFVLTDGSWLREEWRDIYDWCAGRLAPKAWRESLVRSASGGMSTVATAKEGFSPW